MLKNSEGELAIKTSLLCSKLNPLLAKGLINNGIPQEAASRIFVLKPPPQNNGAIKIVEFQ
ncbi:MAG: hypothetical protein P8Z35_20375 [Ignavibacteriaceae bacterium]